MEEYKICPKCGCNNLVEYNLYSESANIKFSEIFCPECEWCIIVKEDMINRFTECGNTTE